MGGTRTGTATWSQPGDGERLWFLGTLATIKVPGEASDGRFALIEFLLPHHASPPLHTHPQDESYIVLEGRMIVVAGERRFELEAGAAAVVPRVCRTRSGWNPAQRVCSCSALRRASSASFVTLLCRRSSRCSRPSTRHGLLRPSWTASSSATARSTLAPRSGRTTDEQRRCRTAGRCERGRPRRLRGQVLHFVIRRVMSARATVGLVKRRADRNHHGPRSGPDFGREWAELVSAQTMPSRPRR